jgi:hypothetical protein
MEEPMASEEHPLAAVGIPQGLMVDPETADTSGAIRVGGELVAVEPHDYRMWALLLTPLPLTAAVEVASERRWQDPGLSVARLRGMGLLVEMSPNPGEGSGLAGLRPIPLGVGLGNSSDAADLFLVQNGNLSLSSPVALDPIATMLWWECDGTSSLAEIVELVATRMRDVPREVFEVAALGLVHELMGQRLLYLDSQAPPGVPA